jgi:hypothetical protein
VVEWGALFVASLVLKGKLTLLVPPLSQLHMGTQSLLKLLPNDVLSLFVFAADAFLRSFIFLDHTLVAPIEEKLN